MRLDTLHRLGFDASAHTFGRKNLLSVACSQCQALCINGTPTHERGCPNQTFEYMGTQDELDLEIAEQVGRDDE